MASEVPDPAIAYDRVVGFLLDILDASGGKPLATYLDCPVCRHPLALRIDHEHRQLRARCPTDPAHFDWEGDFNTLPAWIDEYTELNREDPWGIGGG